MEIQVKDVQEETKRNRALTSVWELTLSERTNAAIFIANTTVTPFIYCRYFLKCFYCKKHYTDINLLLKHTLNHDTPSESIVLKDLLPKGKRSVKVDISELKCRICNEIFTNLDVVRDHLTNKHDKKFTESGNGTVAYNLSVKNGLFHCHLCQRSFQSFILLNRHMNVHFSNAVCETCGTGFMTYQRLLKHKEIHQPGGYPCKTCNKVYTTASNLKFHIEKVHEGNRRMRMLQCTHCTERFTEHFKKLKHLKEIHGITFTFECDVCKMTFTSRRSLTTHTNRIHSEKTRCNHCKKSFSCVTTLKLHLISHTGERNYVCNLCQKSYRYKKSLNQHMRSHFSEKEVRFTCPECSNGFTNKVDFNKHIKEWHPKTYFNYVDNC